MSKFTKVNIDEMKKAGFSNATIRAHVTKDAPILPEDKAEYDMLAERLAVASGSHQNINVVTGYIDMVEIARWHEDGDRNRLSEIVRRAENAVAKANNL